MLQPRPAVCTTPEVTRILDITGDVITFCCEVCF